MKTGSAIPARGRQILQVLTAILLTYWSDIRDRVMTQPDTIQRLRLNWQMAINETMATKRKYGSFAYKLGVNQQLGVIGAWWKSKSLSQDRIRLVASLVSALQAKFDHPEYETAGR